MTFSLPLTSCLRRLSNHRFIGRLEVNNINKGLLTDNSPYMQKMVVTILSNIFSNWRGTTKSINNHLSCTYIPWPYWQDKGPFRDPEDQWGPTNVRKQYDLTNLTLPTENSYGLGGPKVKARWIITTSSMTKAKSELSQCQNCRVLSCRELD